MQQFAHATGRGFVFLECVKAFVVPPAQDFLGPSANKRDMDMNEGTLAYSVDPADALFEHLRVRGQIEEHEISAELEVSSFAADFAAHEHPRAVFLGKPRGVAVALNERQVFVEQSGVYLDVQEYVTLKRHGKFLGRAQNKEFFRGLGFDQLGKPGNARVVI
jgi:hypothetical protein